MKKYLPVAAILLVIAAIFTFILIPKNVAQDQPETIRVTFVNHLAVQLKFSVDDVYICTADAGMSCYADVGFGKHIFRAMEGDKVIRQVETTLDANTVNPRLVVCFPTSPDC